VEAHLSWKRRLDGYCACTAIVKVTGLRQRNENGWVLGWRRGREVTQKKTSTRGFNRVAESNSSHARSPIKTSHSSRSLARNATTRDP
jgi:hypothetical protein